MNAGQAVLVALAVVISTMYALAILWATNRQASYLARFAPIAILLALGLPIGMFDAAAVFAAEAILILGSIFTVRLLRRRLGPPSDRMPLLRMPRQFGLAGLMKSILLVGLLTGLALNAPDELEDSLWGWPNFWPTILESGAVLAGLTFVGWGLGVSRGRWLILYPIAVGILLFGILQALDLLPTPQNVDTHVLPAILIFSSATALAVALLLRLIRAAGWDWSTSSAAQTTDSETADSALSVESPTMRRARRMFFGVVALCAFPIINLYYTLLPPRSMPTQEFPTPNAHSELIRLESQLNWTAIPQRDPDAATATECERFVRDNAGVLHSIDQSLSLDSQVPIVWRETLSPHYGAMRTLYRVQDMRARAAIAAGTPQEACKIYVDAMRIGLVTSRGGLGTDMLVAAAIEKMAVEHLLPLLKDLDGKSLDKLQQELQTILNAREPIEPLLQRADFFDQVSNSWQGRLYRWFHAWGLNDDYFDARTELPKFRMRQDTDLELLIVETALFRYLLTHDTPPDSLAALVPEYLKQIPVDRFGKGPLVYRRTETGYLLYSVGENGVDDGGVPQNSDNRAASDYMLIPL